MPPKTYDIPGAIRREPDESFQSFSARQKASQDAAKPAKPAKKPRVRLSSVKKADEANANRVDGLDRDDLGLSHD